MPHYPLFTNSCHRCLPGYYSELAPTPLNGARLLYYNGRAVLRSVVREFLASEALHHLGIATTRALTIVTSEEPVWREQPETGAMMMRIADSHVRFGHFEHFYYLRQQDNLTRLADCVIERHLARAGGCRRPLSAVVV